MMEIYPRSTSERIAQSVFRSQTVKYPVLIHTSLAFINPSCNRDLRARSGIRSGVYLIPPYRSNPTCFFRCKSRNHLSFYRRSGQKGDRIVIGYYRIVIKYYSVAPQRRACGRDPPIEERRACGRDPPKKKKQGFTYRLKLFSILP